MSNGSNDDKTVIHQRGKPETASPDGNADNKTQIRGKLLEAAVKRVTAEPVPTSAQSSGGTRIIQAGGGSAKVESSSDSGPSLIAPSGEDSFVVGWLVVVEGLGRGRSRELYYGGNTVGRGSDQRVVLDFGDETISRDKAAIIRFDPKNSDFYLLDQNSLNNIYVNGDIVLGNAKLAHGDQIQIGQTKLNFIPLCDDRFSWDASEE
jgi:hypothetical protein